MKELTLTEYAVLGLLGLLRDPISGYDLQKVIQLSVGYIWRPSRSQMYVVLRQLVVDGFVDEKRVRQRDRPDKTLFRITSAGRVTVTGWLNREEAVSDPDRSVLVLKLFFGAQADREAMIRQLVAYRDAFRARLALYEAKFESEDPTEHVVGDLFTELTLEYGIARARAASEWAERSIDRLTH